MFKRLLIAVSLLLMTAMSAVALDVNLSFTPSQVSPNQTSRITINIVNSASFEATNVALQESMNGVFIAPTPNMTTTCANANVTLSNSGTGGTFNIQGATIPSSDVNSGSCVVTFDVTTVSRGNRTISIESGQVTGQIQGSPVTNPQNSTATLITIMSNPTLTMTHLDGRYISHGETARVRFSIFNSNPVPMTGVGFNLTSSTFLNGSTTVGLVPTAGITNTCGGTGNVLSTGASMSGGSIPANSSCSFDIPVQVVSNPQSPRNTANSNLLFPAGGVVSNEGVTNDVTRTLVTTTASGIFVEKFLNDAATSSQNITTTPLTPLTLRLLNYNTDPVPSGSLTDPLPNGMIFESVQSNACGGSLSGVGTSNLVWTGGIQGAPVLARNTQEVFSCDVIVNVRAPSAGTYVNTIAAGNISGYQFAQTRSTLSASAGSLTANLSMRNSAGADLAYWGDTVTATLTLTETTGTIGITNLNVPLSFTIANGFKFDTMLTNTCGGGTVSVTPGSGKANDAVSYVNGNIAAGQTCTVQVRYKTLPDTNVAINTNVDIRVPANAITYFVNGNPQQYALALTGGYYRQVSPFYTTTAYTPQSVGEGGISRLRATINYYSIDGNLADNISFTTPLLDGVLVANIASNPANLINTCGGSINAVAGASTFGLSNGAIPGGRAGSCYIEIPVRTPGLPNGVIQGTTTTTIATGTLDGSDSSFRAIVHANVTSDHQDAVNGRTTGGTLTWSQRDISVTKSFTNTVVDGGASSEVVIRIVNSGNNAIRLTNFGVVDDMTGTGLYVSPTSLRTVSGCGAAQITAVSNSQVARISNGTVNVNQTCVFTFGVYSDTGGNHINTVAAGAVTNNEAVSNASPASATLTVLRNININKSYDRKDIPEGETSLLTFQFVNTNTVNVLGEPTVFQDILGGGLTATRVTNSTCSGANVTASGQNITVSGGTYAASSTCAVTVGVRGDASGIYPNTIPVGAANFRTSDGTSVSNTVETSDTLTVRENPTIIKSIRDSSAQPKTTFYQGETGFFSIVVTGISGDYVEFTDVVSDPAVTLTSVNTGNCNVSPSSTLNGNTVESQIYFDFDDSCEIRASFTAQTPGTFDNVVADMSASYFEPGNGWQERTVPGSNTVNGAVLAPVTLDKTFQTNSVVQYEQTRVVLALTNPNDNAAPVAQLEDILPTGLEVVSGSVVDNCGFSQVTPDTDRVRYSNLSLAANASCTVEFLVLATGTENVTNTAVLTNPNQPDVTDSDILTVSAAAPGFDVVKTPNTAAALNVGDILTWTVEIENTGNTPLSFVDIQDSIPLTGGGTLPVTLTGDTTTPILSGTSRSLTSTATASQDVFDQNDVLTNFVDVSLSAQGGWLESDSALSDIPVSRTPLIEVNKVVIPNPILSEAVENDPIMWRVTVRNAGNVSFDSVNWSDDRVPNANVTLNALSDEDGNGVFSPNETFVFDVSDAVLANDLTSGTAVNTFNFNASGVGVPEFTTQGVGTVSIRGNTAPVTDSDTGSTLTIQQPIQVTVLSNDTDAENNIDPQSVRLVGAPGDGKTLDVPNEGAWTVDTDGSVTFTPISTFYGNPTPVSYVVSDTRGAESAPASITLTYPTIPAPVANPDTFGPFPTNTPVLVDPRPNDTSDLVALDPDSLLIEGGTEYTVAGQGVWRVVSGGVEFEPFAGFTANPTPVSYTIKNVAGIESNAALMTILFEATPPVANSDTLTNQTTGVPAFVNVTNNDNDPDGALDPASVVLVGAPGDGKTLVVPNQGTWSVAADGTVTFAPNPGFTASPTPVSYTVADNDGNVSNPATITFGYAPRPPAAFDDVMSGLSTNTPVLVDVLSNDGDPDGALDPASVVLVGAPGDGKTLIVPNQGTWSVETDGIVTFAPLPGFTSNPDPVSYTVADNDGNVSNSAQILLIFTPQRPVANSDVVSNLTTGSPALVNVLSNDNDPDGALDPASVVLSGAPGDGKTLVVPNQGTWSVETDGTVTFAPLPGFTANPTAVQYTVADNDGNVSNPATILLSYDPRLPMASDDVLSGLPTNTPVPVNVLQNDTDPDGALDITSVVLVGAPGDGKTLLVPNQGTWSVATDGSVTFVPNPGFTANPTPVSYTVADNDGNVSNAAQIRLTFQVLSPVAGPDSVSNIITGTPAFVNVLGNDNDPDGTLDPASVVLIGAPGDGKTLNVPNQGIWSVATDGSVTFVPAPGFTASPTPVSYTVSDNDGNVSNPATITFDYDPRPPLANDDDLTNAPTNAPAYVDVILNDRDPDGALDPATVVLLGAPGDGKTLNVPNVGVWNVLPNGQIVFTPNTGYTGSPAPVQYTVADNDGNVSNPARVTVIFAVLPPIANADTLNNLTTGTPVLVNVLANDSDPDGTLDVTSVVITGAPGDGKTLNVPNEGTWSVNATGQITFAPAPGFTSNPAPITYTAADNDGNRSDVASVTLVFTARPPVALSDTVTGATTGTPVIVTVLGNDGDPDGALNPASVVLVGAPADGKTLVVPNEGTWSVNAAGQITFAPAPGFTANPTPVSYTVSDNDGNVSNPAGVSITFTVQVPTAIADSQSGLTTGASVTVAVLGNDRDPDGSLDVTSVLITGAPGDGKTLVVSNEGTWSVDATGQITFAPAPGFTGNPAPITYTVADNDGNRSNPATVTLFFTPRGPVSVSDVVNNATTGSAVNVAVLGNDSDPDGTLDVSSVLLVGAPGSGKSLTVPNEGTWTVTNNGHIVFTPQTGFTANPTPVQYTVADNDENRSSPASVTIRFVAQAPVADPDFLSDVAIGETAGLDVLGNDSDPDGALDPASVLFVGAPGNGKTLVVQNEGTWTVNTAGRVTFTPNSDFFGSPVPVQYTVADNDGKRSEPALITVTYQVPSKPVSVNDSVSGTVGQPVIIEVLGNDQTATVPLDPASVRIVGASGNGRTLNVDGEGVWTVLNNGDIQFRPNPDFFGDPTPIRYTVSDVSGTLSDEALVSVDYAQDPAMSVDVSLTSIEDVDGDRRNTPGDIATYAFRVTNTGNIPLTDVLVSVARMSGLICEPATVPVGETVTLSCTGATITFTKADADRGRVIIEANFSAEAIDDTLRAEGDVTVQVVKAETDRPLRIEVSKRAETDSTVSVGQNVPYVIVVRNLDTEAVVTVDVIDRLPAGLSLIKDSTEIGGVNVRTETHNRDIIWNDVRIPAGGSVRLNLTATVTSFDDGVKNLALVTDPQDRSDVVARSEATVEKDERGVPVFECATVIGRVFEDVNGNAWQDDGERGVGGIRVITARGTSIVTDKHGRYSVPCAEAPEAIGSNIILKVDSRTLPDDYVVSTENPKIVRLTAGKMTDASFGIRKNAPIANVTVNADAFQNGDLTQEFRAAIETTVRNSKGVEIRFEILYVLGSDEPRDVARKNARALANFINGLRGAHASVSIQH